MTCQVRLPDVCNHDPATTVLAHYRLAGISGLGIKAPNVLGAWACSSCHTYVDTHKDVATQLSFLQGIMRTIANLVEDGVLKW